MGVWLCGIAPSAKSEWVNAESQVAWCSTRSGGKRLRSLIGPQFCQAALANAANIWLGRRNQLDIEPPVEFGELLLRRILTESGGNPTCIALFGLSYWRSVIRHCAEDCADLEFYRSPESGSDLLCGFNALRANKDRFAQIELLPHPRHWSVPKKGETVSAYRERSAAKVEQNRSLNATSDDFMASVDELMAAFDNPLRITRKMWENGFR